MTIERIAYITHEANKAYCQTIGDNLTRTTAGLKKSVEAAGSTAR